MRRTTQWAVFTSMNQQKPTWRSLYEPADAAADTEAADAVSDPRIAAPASEPRFRTASDTSRDRVDFM